MEPIPKYEDLLHLHLIVSTRWPISITRELDSDELPLNFMFFNLEISTGKTVLQFLAFSLDGGIISFTVKSFKLTVKRPPCCRHGCSNVYSCLILLNYTAYHTDIYISFPNSLNILC